MAVNLRAQDRFILDGLVTLSQIDRCDITTIARRALEYYIQVREKAIGNDGTKKMDEFISGIDYGDILSTLLTPELLEVFSDSEILSLAKIVRARRQELDGELRKRGYYLKW